MSEQGAIEAVAQALAAEIGAAGDPNALMRVLETVARSLGWECESDRMGGDDGEASFEFYAWRAK